MPKSSQRCREIREEMRSKILHDSMLYFARNGFSGTKISDLSKYIGIGQGTIYVYFESKEELFKEIFKMTNYESDVKEIKMLSYLPIPARLKIHKLSESVLDRLESDEAFAGKVALNTQISLEENDYISEVSTYRLDLYRYTVKLIEQGQKEGSAVPGSPMKLADYYWGIVYLYALKRLFTQKYEMITVQDLERVLLRD